MRDTDIKLLSIMRASWDLVGQDGLAGRQKGRLNSAVFGPRRRRDEGVSESTENDTASILRLAHEGAARLRSRHYGPARKGHLDRESRINGPRRLAALIWARNGAPVISGGAQSSLE